MFLTRRQIHTSTQTHTSTHKKQAEVSYKSGERVLTVASSEPWDKKSQSDEEKKPGTCVK